MKPLRFRRPFRRPYLPVRLIIAKNKRFYTTHSLSGGRLTLALPRRRKPSKIEIGLRDILFSNSFTIPRRRTKKNELRFF